MVYGFAAAVNTCISKTAISLYVAFGVELSRGACLPPPWEEASFTAQPTRVLP